MMYKLLEDIQDVEGLINYIEDLVLRLRKSEVLQKDPHIFKYVADTYMSSVGDFYRKYFLEKRELSTKEEEILTNDLLDLISLLEKLK